MLLQCAAAQQCRDALVQAAGHLAARHHRYVVAVRVLRRPGAAFGVVGQIRRLAHAAHQVDAGKALQHALLPQHR
ncbi:hypothetical protein D3C72_2533810 [compost metagenome]